jgi:hypothetical protein
MPALVLPVPEYRLEFRVGSIPKCQVVMPLVCPWRQGTPHAAVIATMTFSLAERVPSAVLIITLPGITLAGFASGHGAEWFHIMEKTLRFSVPILSNTR